MALYKEQERICRQLGNIESLATSLANQALVMGERGWTREALVLAEEAHKLASDHGYVALTALIASLLNRLRSAGN